MSAENIWDSVPPRSNYPLAAGVRSRTLATSRLRQHIYAGRGETGERLLLVHGNASSARFFEGLIASLPELEIVAPDLRGYGATEAQPADATRGLRDYSDDLEALVVALGWERFHLLGWSLGGNIALQYTIDHPERVQTLTLHSAGSPFGYGGSHGDDGAPNYPDFAGSGGGLIAPAVIDAYRAKDTTADSPFTPRSTLRAIIVKQGFLLPKEQEDALVEQMLMMVIGDEFYPGDSVESPNWPFAAPGVWGPNNALSPKYCDLSGLARIQPQPPILWARGADDVLVSDAAVVDPATLGQLGAIPGWPGAQVCPPQPMLRQLRALLDAYRANGGVYEERVLDDCGHSPLLEKPDEFRAALLALIDAHRLAPRPQPQAEPTAEPTSEPPVTAAPAQAKRGPLSWFRRR